MKDERNIDLDQNSNLSLYIASFYAMITCMASVGYGDIHGDTKNEMCFTMILEFTGLLLHVAIIWAINQMIAVSHNKEASKVHIYIYIYIYI